MWYHSEKEWSYKQNSKEIYKTKLRGTYDKFPDFFGMDTFIDSTHMKLYSPSK